MTRLERLAEGQKEFQRLVGKPIDSVVETDRNALGEEYLFKTIEEIVECRKEFPSVLNKYSKEQKNANLTRVKEEFGDVIMFLINFMNVWHFSFEEVLTTLESIQRNNFQKVKEKKMNLLNADILKIPGYISGIGQGNLTPKYVFVGQNPGTTITHGYKFWSNEEDGSSKALLPILKKLGVYEQSYFTNVVKCVTPYNDKPNEDLTKFFMEFYKKELEILRFNNPHIKVVALGKWVSDTIQWDITLKHPSYVLRGGITQEEYEKEVTEHL